VIAIISLLLMAGQPAADCENAVTQADMNQCAHHGFAASDAALNAQWKITSEVMKQRDENYGGEQDIWRGHFVSLLQSQFAWINYRSAQCRSEGYLARGGSMETMLVSICLANLTKQRTQQLNKLAETF